MRKFIYLLLSLLGAPVAIYAESTAIYCPGPEITISNCTYNHHYKDSLCDYQIIDASGQISNQPDNIFPPKIKITGNFQGQTATLLFKYVFHRADEGNIGIHCNYEPPAGHLYANIYAPHLVSERHHRVIHHWIKFYPTSYRCGPRTSVSNCPIKKATD